ncbi:DUF6074 family protein [Chelativorans sp. Marseille-P2723]|uniref:DUF6074 family protein n=1 Tax=Chelativorans sp. Marseille-P2723 TaxID=2709133 RepID=UPI001FEFC129|nr:DUF6074 family protein [Chelativorans sp. Marseille-P2723]
MSSTVVTFPLHRRQRLLNGIAQVLRTKQGDEANQFWRETAKGLLQQLTANGVDVRSAEEEVRYLLHAVLSQIEADAAKAEG